MLKYSAQNEGRSHKIEYGQYINTCRVSIGPHRDLSHCLEIMFKSGPGVLFSLRFFDGGHAEE